MTGSFKTQMLHKGDFLREWQTIEDGSIDLVICDPPYGELRRVHDWDNKPDFAVVSSILNHLLRSPTGQVAVFSSAKMLTEVETAFSKYFDRRFIQIWQKPNAQVMHKDRPKPDVEFVSVFHRKGCKKDQRVFNWEDVAQQGKPYSRANRNLQQTNLHAKKRAIDVNATGLRYPSSIVHHPNRPAMTSAEKAYGKHQAQKSLQHIINLIRLLSNPGDTVLDPFMGSGTAILAAIMTGRRAVGWDILEEFVAMTAKRIEMETAQGVLI
ncbi:MAG: site-specific DNA-methyltransferase [Candidatus Marinimicrobia bacterium]|nr:site-specific DNA-methyltransferase [Candidatus Neomarinimicrobiota bacterium]